MEKVLIISYFFPPCNLTASQRAYNWAKYLKGFGYAPVVITRNWDVPIQTPADVGISSQSLEVVEELTDQYRVFYMPYVASLKDRIFHKNRGNKKLLRKALSLKELYLQNFSINALPYANIYYMAEEVIEKEGIEKVVITVNPFACLHFGARLKKKFPAIRWVADYRDDWTTTELVKRDKGIDGQLFKLEQKSEKKWVGSASFFTTVSEYYVNKISRFTGLKGYELINGFGEELEGLLAENVDKDCFEITYNGSLYASQNIEPFLAAVKKVMQHFEGKIHVHLNFPGLLFDKVQAERVQSQMQGFEGNLTITPRIPREEVISMQLKSQLLLMIAHQNLKGVPSSKLYEYIGLRKPVLLYPNDHDIIESTLLDTELGIICENEREIETKLINLIDEFIKREELPIKVNENKRSDYSRKNQVKKLATLLDKL